MEAAINALAGRLSELAARIDARITQLDSRVVLIARRLHDLEVRSAPAPTAAKRKLQDAIAAPFALVHAASGADLVAPTKKGRFVMDDQIALGISVDDLALLKMTLCGPVKDALHEVGRQCLERADLALRLLRVGSDRCVAIAVFHAAELEPLRQSISWITLPPHVRSMIEQAFIKSVAKKVEHTKRKVKQKATAQIVESSKGTKADGPFVKDLLAHIAQFGSGACGLGRFCLMQSSTPNTLSSSAEGSNDTSATTLPATTLCGWPGLESSGGTTC